MSKPRAAKRRKLTQRQLERLAKHIETRAQDVSGWVFSYEYPGFFQFCKDGLVLCCTPDWNEAGYICLQFMNDQGHHIDTEADDIKYTDPLKAAQFIELLRPVLEKFGEAAATPPAHLFSQCGGQHGLIDGRPIAHDCEVVTVHVLQIDRDFGATRARNLWRLINHTLSPAHIRAMSRQEMIDLCGDNDPNGCYTDEDHIAEFGIPITDDEFREILYDWITLEHAPNALTRVH